MGAWPLARTIQENVKKPLAEELLFGKLAKGGLVRLDVKDDKIVFDYPPTKPADKLPQAAPETPGAGTGELNSPVAFAFGDVRQFLLLRHG